MPTRPADRPVLFLLMTSSTSRHQRVYGGMCLTEERPEYEDLERGVTVRLSRPGHPVPIRLVHHDVTSSHLSTDRGSVWETDGRFRQTSEVDWNEEQQREARNQVDRLKFVPPAAELALPAFAGNMPNLHPCCDDLIVRMLPRRIVDLPDVRVMAQWVTRGVPEHSSIWTDTPVGPGLVTPVEYGGDRHPTRCALHLRAPAEGAPGGRRFRCRLYRSDATAPLAVGTILHRRAARHLETYSIREQADVAEILAIEASGRPLDPESPGTGIVRAEENGAVFPILCSSCGATFPPERFTPEQLQTLDTWGWYHPIEHERSLSARVQAMYRRHPQARGRVRTKFRATFLTPGVVRDLNATIGQVPDPRPASYQQNLDAWTEGDRELREFLETHTCDHDRRFDELTRQAAKYERRLGGQCVVCPACGAGMLRTPTELGLRATDTEKH